VVCGIVVGVFLPTAVAGWAHILHWSCQPTALVKSISNYYIPAVLVNSPYGGQAWGNGTFPPTFPGISNGPPGQVNSISYGTGALDGGALGAFFTVNVGVYRLSNETQWGPGSNVRCTQAYAASLRAPAVYGLAGGAMLGANNISDDVEPTQAVLPVDAQEQAGSITFNDSFFRGNSANVSTCNLPSRSVPLVISNRLTVWFPVSLSDRTVQVPFIIPVTESYHYTFPANFGI
jgi:hypothetical protein